MKYDRQIFDENDEREFFEQKIFNFSKNLFYYPKVGFVVVLAFDILYIYLMLNSRSVFSIIFYFFLVYLLISILLVQLFRKQKKE